jgi:hypothetical protein
MRLGKKLWLLIGLKLLIMFGLLKLFLFPDVLSEGLNSDSARSDFVSKRLLQNANEQTPKGE